MDWTSGLPILSGPPSFLTPSFLKPNIKTHLLDPWVQTPSYARGSPAATSLEMKASRSLPSVPSLHLHDALGSRRPRTARGHPPSRVQPASSVFG